MSDITACPQCEGFIEVIRMRDHGISITAIHCLMCGRYFYRDIVTASVRPFSMREIAKPWKRVKSEIPGRVKQLLYSGHCPTVVARKVGIHVNTVRKMIAVEGWDYRPGRAIRRGGGNEEI